MTIGNLTVRQAGTGDAEAISHILGRGFHDDPPLQWILPDADERSRLGPGFFRPFVDLVLEAGRGYVTNDLTGAALWLDVDVTSEPEDDGGALRKQIVDAIGPSNAERFFQLDDLFSANHPGHESHAYLVFVGVVPERQSQGIGTGLLVDRLAELDQAGRPAYLEASSARNASLYSRLGFAPIGGAVTPPGGPSLFPMWRPTSAPATA